MKRISILIVILCLVIGGVVLFYAKKSAIEKQPKIETQREVLYWTCAMHPSVRSDEPGDCPICNMPLIPVYKEAPASEEKQPISEKETKEVYYGCGVKEEGHCPHCDEGVEDAKCICGQHSFIIEAQPMKCPVCGKELKKIEPRDVKAIEENVVSRVTLKGTQLELAGVKTEQVKRHHLTKEIRTVGKIAFDPELAVAQEEFLTSIETKEKLKDSPDLDVKKRAGDLVEKSRFKLRLLGMSDDEIADLEKRKTAQLNLVLPEEKAWIYADIYEYELGWAKIGQNTLITTTAYPDEEFTGIVKSISPVLDPMTRSVRVRIEVDNKMNKLKPEMYADVIIESMYVAEDGSHEVLSIPKETVLDTGIRKIVYVDLGNGEFVGRQIKTGPEAVAMIDGQKIKMYPVLGGLEEGENVVTKGNFLIDSQSQLTGGMSVLWGGATEIKKGEAPQETVPIKKEHRH